MKTTIKFANIWRKRMISVTIPGDLTKSRFTTLRQGDRAWTILNSERMKCLCKCGGYTVFLVINEIMKSELQLPTEGQEAELT